jgi:hypothetical protein
VGGVKDSAHLVGLAVDIEIKTDWQRLRFLESAVLAGIKRIHISKTYVHVDVDATKNDACWVY